LKNLSRDHLCDSINASTRLFLFPIVITRFELSR
jgi:hypothetical protein